MNHTNEVITNFSFWENLGAYTEVVLHKERARMLSTYITCAGNQFSVHIQEVYTLCSLILSRTVKVCL